MKVAILLEWKRMFGPKGISGGLRYVAAQSPAIRHTVNSLCSSQLACNIILALTIAFYVSIEVAGNLSYRPFQRIWDKRVPGVCFNRTHMDIAVVYLNICSHLCILVLPHKVIWGLQLPIKKKIGVAFVFAFGIV